MQESQSLKRVGKAKPHEDTVHEHRKSRPHRRGRKQAGRSGIRTGQPAHFALWMADLAAKSALQRLKLDRLAEATEGDTAAGLAILRVNGVKNVWDLSRLGTDNRRGLVEKLNPNQIEAVTAYLSQNRVIADWSE